MSLKIVSISLLFEYLSLSRTWSRMHVYTFFIWWMRRLQSFNYFLQRNIRMGESRSNVFVSEIGRYHILTGWAGSELQSVKLFGFIEFNKVLADIYRLNATSTVSRASGSELTRSKACISCMVAFYLPMPNNALSLHCPFSDYICGMVWVAWKSLYLSSLESVVLKEELWRAKTSQGVSVHRGSRVQVPQ